MQVPTDNSELINKTKLKDLTNFRPPTASRAVRGDRFGCDLPFRAVFCDPSTALSYLFCNRNLSETHEWRAQGR
jgi:hypothetical protein